MHSSPNWRTKPCLGLGRLQCTLAQRLRTDRLLRSYELVTLAASARLCCGPMSRPAEIDFVAEVHGEFHPVETAIGRAFLFSAGQFLWSASPCNTVISFTFHFKSHGHSEVHPLSFMLPHLARESPAENGRSPLWQVFFTMHACVRITSKCGGAAGLAKRRAHSSTDTRMPLLLR